MNSFRNRFAAWTAIAVLGAGSLFAAQTAASGGGHRHGRHGGMLAALNLTDAQKAQTKSIFQEARQSSEPVRQQLKQTHQALQAATKANDTAQMQQLSATEGTQVGQLAAIRSGAMAKVFQVLTPDQQQKLTEMQQARKARHQGNQTGQQN
jgi:Spy/CpxP family protein refolding chaperone